MNFRSLLLPILALLVGAGAHAQSRGAALPPAFEPALNPQDDVIVCSRKVPAAADGTGAHRFEIFAILQSSRIAYFETERGQVGTFDYSSFIAVGENLSVEHALPKPSAPGNRTLSIDLRWASGKRTDTTKPNETIAYPFCASFSSYNPTQIQSWLRQTGIIPTPAH